MLKIKESLHYRRGYTHAHCSDCNFFIDSFKLGGINGADLGTGPRCEKIGLKPGRMYAVCGKNICDLFDNSVSLARIKGE